jgi:hypothetical protein
LRRHIIAAAWVADREGIVKKSLEAAAEENPSIVETETLVARREPL